MAGLTLSRDSVNESSDRWHAITAGFLGWTLDAFDFFVVIFLFDVLAQHFHVTRGAIVLSVTGTLGPSHVCQSGASPPVSASKA